MLFRSVMIENRGNPGTIALPNLWIRPDEWYDWQANPREKVQVLASIDESIYRPENPQDHPITWCHWQGKGRAWYTEMGHFKDAYSEKPYMDMLYGGLIWAAQGSRIPENATTFSDKARVSGDFLFHAEFLISKGQKSTIKLGEKNAIAISDSEGVAWNKLTASECGGVNGSAPIVNAFAGSKYWNTIYLAYSANTSEISEMRINGIVVQAKAKLNFEPSPTIALTKGPISFRNAWVKRR